MTDYKYDICVVGGGGHVGLPLSLVFSDKGMKVCIFDIDKEKLEKIEKGEMPFLEEGAEELLERNIGKTLFVSSEPDCVKEGRFVVLIVGTPLDDHLNPEFTLIKNTFSELLPYFRDGQILVLRSTVYPGTSQRMQEFLKERGVDIQLTFCPERIAEGKALKEIKELPQIVSGFNKKAVDEVSGLFKKVAEEVIVLTPLEAELAKLFTNSWRYIKFAISNQFYVIAKSQGVDFYKIYKAIKHNYPRTKDFPGAGFTAGPCLLKDTMQLAAFNQNNFPLGQAAMFVNEGLPNFIIEELKKRQNLKEKTVGILGMAFKADSDDKRHSLAYKLRKILELEARKVLCSDVYIKEEGFISAEELISQSDIIIVAAPHREYKNLNIPENKILVDVWNFYEK